MLNRFDLRERSYEFSKRLVLFLSKLEFKKLFYPIVDQLLRSATSIGANIIEGMAGNSRKNLINFFSIALRSANETKYWLRLIRDTMNISDGEMGYLIAESDEISKILAKSILTMKRNDLVTENSK